MESNLSEVLDAMGDQGAMEKNPHEIKVCYIVMWTIILIDWESIHV